MSATGPTEPPRPGDPRDTGPRPPARVRDVVWLVVAGVLLAVTAAQVVVLARLLVSPEAPRFTTPGLLLGFAFTVVWLLTIAWVALGSWRRTVWGCPFAHTADAAPARRCPRHGSVNGTTSRDAPAGPPHA
jgi:hypothetical protein